MTQMMWFGNTRYATWLPTPSAGMQREQNGFYDEMAFQNGGGAQVSSDAFANVYQMEWSGKRDDTINGLSTFTDFSAGLYGKGFLYWTDCMVADQNIFSSQWASPMLIEGDWKNIANADPTFSDTPANSHNYPIRSATWTVNESSLPTARNRVFTALIPPDHTIHLGGVGSSTGTAGVAVWAVGLDSDDDRAHLLPLGSAGSAPTFSLTLDGNTFKAIRVFLYGSGTVTLTGLWGQVLRDGLQPQMQQYIPGRGTTGGLFQGKTMPKSYVYGPSKIVSLSAPLVEREQWMNSRHDSTIVPPITPIPLPPAEGSWGSGAFWGSGATWGY